MTIVRIIKNWDWPDLMRQTPYQRAIWDNIQITVAPFDSNAGKIMTRIPPYKKSINTLLNRAFLKIRMAIMQEKYKIR